MGCFHSDTKHKNVAYSCWFVRSLYNLQQQLSFYLVFFCQLCCHFLCVFIPAEEVITSICTHATHDLYCPDIT